jgi:hypothetical protein
MGWLGGETSAAMLIDSSLDDALERTRQRLAEDIRNQQRLLDDLRARTHQAQGELAAVEQNRLAELTLAFDAQLAVLSPWLAESRSGLLKRLRKTLPDIAARGGELPDLKALCRNSPIERDDDNGLCNFF